MVHLLPDFYVQKLSEYNVKRKGKIVIPYKTITHPTFFGLFAVNGQCKILPIFTVCMTMCWESISL